MKKRLMAMVGVVVVCVLLAVVSNAMAADANQPKEKSKDGVIGIVTVVKDNDGNIAEIKVKVHKDLIYQVVLDEKGIELGKTMAGKRVKIAGTIEKKGDAEWVTVKTFSELKPRTEAKPKAKPTGKPRQNQ